MAGYKLIVGRIYGAGVRGRAGDEDGEECFSHFLQISTTTMSLSQYELY